MCVFATILRGAKAHPSILKLLWLSISMVLLFWNLHADSVDALVRTSFNKFKTTSCSIGGLSTSSPWCSDQSVRRSFSHLHMSTGRKDNALSYINGNTKNKNKNLFGFDSDVNFLDGRPSSGSGDDRISSTQLSAVSSTLDSTRSTKDGNKNTSNRRNRRKRNDEDTLNKLENSHMKLGILLLNLGGPETQQDVEGFLYNLFADPDIIRLPPGLALFQKPLAMFIAKRRAPKSREAYQSIGGGSPIVSYTSQQASLIEEELLSRGLPSKAYFAMRYWHPFTEDVLDRMQEDGINAMVIIPLYPQFSISTSGSSLRILQEIFYKNPDVWGPDKVAHTVVPSWYHREGYVEAMAQLCIKEIVKYSPSEMKQGLHILFSAHGVPQSYIEAGDPYQRQIEECVKLVSTEVSAILTDPTRRPNEISEELCNALSSGENAVEYHLSFQSRVGPVQWLRPYTEETLETMGARGVKNLIVVPVSFVSEHVETLEEIDMEYRELAEENGITNWRRVPALNTDEIFINDMADLVIEALESPAVSVAEAQASSDVSQDSALESRLGVSNFNSKKAYNIEKNTGLIVLIGILGYELLMGHPIQAITSLLHQLHIAGM